jgi:DNA-binding beta-propeller fold protein YncE
MREADRAIAARNTGSTSRPFMCALLLAAALSLVISASASALSQRGHTFSTTFGTPGSANGQLLKPAGIAVNEETGDVYVVDAGNNRVDRFNSAGVFIAAWGFGVADGKKSYEVCTTECKKGLVAKGRGGFFAARSIGVDNSKSSPSHGDVYVEVQPFEFETEKGHEIEREFAVIDKLTSTGTQITQINGFKETQEPGETLEEIEEPWGMTVNENGEVSMFKEEELITWNNAVINKTKDFKELEFEGEAAPGLAIDEAGNALIGVEDPSGSPIEIAEVNSSGLLLATSIFGRRATGVAMEYGQDDVIIDNGRTVSVLGPDHVLLQTLNEEQSEAELGEGAGVAVNVSTGTIYVADAGAGRVSVFGPEAAGQPTVDSAFKAELTSRSVQLNASIDPHGSDTDYSFIYSTGALPPVGQPCVSPCVEAPVPAADLGAGFGAVPATPLQIEGLTPETRYVWAVRASNEHGGVQSIEREFTTPIVEGSALPDGRVWEQVSPQNKNGAAIFAFPKEGGATESSLDGQKATYVASGAIPNSEGKEDPEGNHAPELTQIVSTWHETGWTSQDVDHQFEAGEGVFPGNGNGYRMFTPDLSQASLQVLGSSKIERPPLDGSSTQERTPYVRDLAAECTIAPAPTSCFQPLLTSALTGAREFGGKASFVGGSADLQHVVIESTAPLTSQPVTSQTNLYEITEGSLKLVNVLPGTTETAATGSALGFRGGAVSMVENAVSEDGSRVVWGVEGSTPGNLFLRDTATGKTVQLDAQQPGVEVSKTLYPSVPATYEHAYYEGATPDDSRIFFSDEWRLTKDSTAAPGRQDLYECEIEESEGEPKCKLTDLTASGNSELHAGVLGFLGYGGEQDSSGAPTSATVYYVANGALGENTAATHCEPGTVASSKSNEEEEGKVVEATALNQVCNLYAQHYDAGTGTWSAPKLITQLSQEDEPDWLAPSARHASERGLVRQVTSRVAPNGQYLTFMSDRSLTGYDTREAHNGRPVEEVYLYKAASEGTAPLVCASCNPEGKRPTGIFDHLSAGEGQGLAVDRELRWAERWLSGSVPGWTPFEAKSSFYQSRYLSSNGRLFFNSVEALVPQDTNGKEDVYEFEFVGVGGCTTASETYAASTGGCIAMISSGSSTHESVFLDASEGGGDVFFTTDAKLDQLDGDSAVDVYDAAICGREGARNCVLPPAASKPFCELAQTCKPNEDESPEQAPFASPSTTVANGSTNSGKQEVLGTTQEKAKTNTPAKPKPLTRAQKLTKALKACHKIHNHKKRVSCERTARKHYGPVKKTAKKSSGSGR